MTAPVLVKKTMVNTSAFTTVWGDLQRVDPRLDKEGSVVAQAGSTLELDPGEQAAVMVPADFVDAWLKEATVGAPRQKKEEQKKEE